MRDDGDDLLLSQLTHAGYCLRRAALVMNEQLWSESSDTAKGRLEHNRVHDRRIERRGSNVKLYGYDVFSESLGLRGKCDCVEAAEDAHSCRIPAVEFPVRLYPVEFKHGAVRHEEEYELQLCAQAMCLEEMYSTLIPEGAIFYTSSHRRVPVQLTESMRQKVRLFIQQLRHIHDDFELPTAEYGPKCQKCSLRENCLPKVRRSASEYCRQIETEAEEVPER